MNETVDPIPDNDPTEVALRQIAEDKADFVRDGGDATEYDETLAAGHAAWEDRMASAQDITRTDVYLPQLPEARATEIADRIGAAERSLVAGEKSAHEPLQHADYDEGTALVDDDTVVLKGRGDVVLTAEHATNVVRKATGLRDQDGADHGTAGLARVLHEDTHATAIIPVGRQTGNAAVNMEYPLKDKIKLHLPGASGFFSVHGMTPGKAEGVFGRREVQAILGLGSEPNDMSVEVAHLLKEYAADLGIKIQISTEDEYLFITGDPPIVRRGEDGQPVWKTLGARNAGSTVNLATKTMTEAGTPIPAMQVEMTRMLRVLPEEKETRSVQSKVYGVYCGYLITQKLVELMAPRS